MKKLLLIAIAVLAMMLLSQSSRSADHIDSPRALSAGPEVDVTDQYAWMSPDAKSVFIVMGFLRNASVDSRFSDSAQYVVRTFSRQKFGDPPGPEVDIICVFSKAQIIQCWAGNESYVTGDASNPAGITSADGKLRVFAGLRSDAMFFNSAGFRATARMVTAALPNLQVDTSGCPQVNAETSAALIKQLGTSPTGGTAVNAFNMLNDLDIALVVDKSILTKNGPILSISLATYRP
jgi:hypothetical protein